MASPRFQISRNGVGEDGENPNDGSKRLSGGATLYVRTIFFSIGATLRAIGLFLPHNMAIERGQHQEGKKRKKGLARLCGSTTGAIVFFYKGFGGIYATLSGAHPP
jgi:hypothetical protein